jgi:hypothetical protein
MRLRRSLITIAILITAMELYPGGKSNSTARRPQRKGGDRRTAGRPQPNGIRRWNSPTQEGGNLRYTRINADVARGLIAKRSGAATGCLAGSERRESGPQNRVPPISRPSLSLRSGPAKRHAQRGLLSVSQSSRPGLPSNHQRSSAFIHDSFPRHPKIPVG